MHLKTETYLQQQARWPQQGRGILAHYDDDTVVVYQAYNPRIGRFALEHQRFGGEFKFTRMSWIKPNFMWMMYRCGWASKEGQEVVLGIRITRSGFEQCLAAAVPSGFKPGLYPDRDAWQQAVSASEVRLQWDPDHSPSGGKLERRAIQLGLRGTMLRQFATDWIVEVIDMTAFVKEQAVHIQEHDRLQSPVEHPYPHSPGDFPQLELEW